MTSRTWCFTWNNYSADNEMLLQNTNLKYICYGRETASTGTKHLQGVLVLYEPQRMSHLKFLFGNSPHWEVCRSLPASITYCKKENDYYEKDNRKPRGRKKKEVVASGAPSSHSVVHRVASTQNEKIDAIIKKSILKIGIGKIDKI